MSFDSKPLGFKVSQVLPERRWAIRETGDIMDQRSFEDDYLRYMTGFGLPSFVDPKFEPVPCVERFVAKTLDPGVGGAVQKPSAIFILIIPAPEHCHNKCNRFLCNSAGWYRREAFLNNSGNQMYLWRAADWEDRVLVGFVRRVQYGK